MERDLDKVHDRLDGINTFAEGIARLSVQTAQRQGIEVAKKSLVFFVKGALKTTVMEQWTKWEETSRALAHQPPSERPLPWKLQVANAFVAYWKERFTGMHNEVVDLASTLPTVVNAASHPKPKSDA